MALAESLEQASQPATIHSYLERSQGARAALAGASATVARMVETALTERQAAVSIVDVLATTSAVATLNRVHTAALQAEIDAKRERNLMVAAYAVYKDIALERSRADAFGCICDCVGEADDAIRSCVYAAMCEFVPPPMPC